MKNMLRLVVVCFVFFSTSVSTAQDDDPAAAIKAAIRGMYNELAAGDFDAALGERIMIGATGFLRDGLLREAPDEKTLAMVVAQYKAAAEAGMVIQLMPSHINVKGNDRGAVATFLLEGTFKESKAADTIRVLDRASHLWLNVDGKWKLAHFHYSRLELPEDGEEEEEEEEHEDDEEDDCTAERDRE